MKILVASLKKKKNCRYDLSRPILGRVLRNILKLFISKLTSENLLKRLRLYFYNLIILEGLTAAGMNTTSTACNFSLLIYYLL